MNWVDKLERKIGKYYIRNLMFFIVMITAFVYVLYSVYPNVINIRNLRLIPSEVMNGEIWRLITFIFVPAGGSFIAMFFSLYLNYIAGAGLEQEWGGFKFNVFYLVCVLTAIIISFLTNAETGAAAINLSLFLAFAKVYPDFEFLLFFILPIKVKWLAIFNIVLIFFNVYNSPNIPYALVAITPLISYLIFFGKDIFSQNKTRVTSAIRKYEYNTKISEAKELQDEIKKCTVCGITEKEDEDMEFRYCSKCNGKYLYCSKHIKDHNHIE